MSAWPKECETGTKEAEIMGIQESSTEIPLAEKIQNSD